MSKRHVGQHTQNSTFELEYVEHEHVQLEHDKTKNKIEHVNDNTTSTNENSNTGNANGNSNTGNTNGNSNTPR